MTLTQTTYAEEMGEDPFDWEAFVNHKSHTEKEWRKAIRLSKSWKTNAMACQSKDIPRYKINRPFNPKKPHIKIGFIKGVPKNYNLHVIASIFNGEIQRRDLNRARSSLRWLKEKCEIILKPLK